MTMWDSSEPSRASKKEVINVVSLGSCAAWEALYMSAIMIGLVESLARIARRVASGSAVSAIDLISSSSLARTEVGGMVASVIVSCVCFSVFSAGGFFETSLPKKFD